MKWSENKKIFSVKSLETKRETGSLSDVKHRRLQSSKVEPEHALETEYYNLTSCHIQRFVFSPKYLYKGCCRYFEVYTPKNKFGSGWIRKFENLMWGKLIHLWRNSNNHCPFYEYCLQSLRMRNVLVLNMWMIQYWRRNDARNAYS